VAESRVYLLSPARTDGPRAKLLFNPRAAFSLAVRLRTPEGAELGEVFSFLSGLYFRGKLTYARTFAPPPGRAPSILVITPERGLLPPETRVTIDDLLAFSQVDIAAGEERYLTPLARDANALASRVGDDAEIVLLGSIATGKYVDALVVVFGTRLVFPPDFVGRGDMSRGGLLLRSAREGRELPYMPVEGAQRRGKRPPRLERVPRSR
jgi:hypothetical protein